LSSPAYKRDDPIGQLRFDHAGLSAEDGYGGRYGLVRDRRTGYLTATLRIVPTSTWLADTGDADGWVANWGAWLASLGYLPTVRWVTVTVDTASGPVVGVSL